VAELGRLKQSDEDNIRTQTGSDAKSWILFILVLAKLMIYNILNQRFKFQGVLLLIQGKYQNIDKHFLKK